MLENEYSPIDSIVDGSLMCDKNSHEEKHSFRICLSVDLLIQNVESFEALKHPKPIDERFSTSKILIPVFENDSIPSSSTSKRHVKNRSCLQFLKQKSLII